MPTIQIFQNCKVVNWKSKSTADEDVGIDVEISNTGKKYAIEIPQLEIKDNAAGLEIQIFEPQLSVVWNAEGPLRVVQLNSEDDFKRFREMATLVVYAAKNKLKYDALINDSETVEWLLGYPLNDALESAVDDADVDGMEWETSTPGRSLITHSIAQPVGDGIVASTVDNTLGLFSPKGPTFEVRTRTDLKRASGIGVYGADSPFSPSALMFHARDKEILMLDDEDDDEKRRQMHTFNVERGIVNTFKCERNEVDTPLTLLSPVAKGQTPDQYILTGNRSELLLVDRRIEKKNAAGRIGGKSRPAEGSGTTCIASDGAGHIVAGLEGGQIRCFKSILDKNEQQRAVTLLPGTGDRIRFIDITQDGSLILATCEYKLLLIPTREDQRATTGPTVFEKSQRPDAIVLQLTYKDALDFYQRFGDTRFTKARFDTVTSAGETERVITTSAGSVLITWNLRRAIAGKGEYRTREVTGKVVDAVMEHGEVYHTDVLLPGHLERVSRKGPAKRTREEKEKEAVEEEDAGCLIQ